MAPIRRHIPQRLYGKSPFVVPFGASVGASLANPYGSGGEEAAKE